LYLAHLSFPDRLRGRGRSRKPWHGKLTCLVEADSIERALGKLETLVRRFAETSDVVKGVRAIYLDSCVEVVSMPKAGLVAHVSLLEGETAGEMYTSLPNVPEKYAAAYHLESGGESPDEDEERDELPFVEIGRGKPRSKAR
jgi:hypothetical protein